MDALEFEKLVDDAEYINYDYSDTGEMVLSVHFQSCFFFWNSHSPELREAIVGCYNRYMHIWGSNITWGFNPKSWKQRPLEKLPSLHDIIIQSDPDDAIEWYVADGGCKGNEVDYVNRYVFSLLTSRAWQIHECGLLTFRVPRALYFDENAKKQIIEFNNFCISQLKPWFALSGMQAATPFSDERIKIDLVSQARDFKGIYTNDSWDTVRMVYGIRSIDWLTYISAEHAEKIGGLKVLENKLKQAKLSYQIDSNGILIQATAHPELIPIHEQVPSGYINLNQILRPLRDGNYGSMGDGTYLGDNIQSFDERLTDLWMRRFDHKSVWNDLQSTAKARKPFVSLTVQSNQVCPRSGHYRYENDYDYVRDHPRHVQDEASKENDYRSYITLNKGDIAPYYLKLDQYGKLIEVMNIEWTLFEEFNYQ